MTHRQEHAAINVGDDAVQISANKLETFYGLKYGPDLIQRSQRRDGEPVASYIDRLKELYPSDEQKAYLDALAAVTKIAIFGLLALQQYATGQTINAKVEAVFPQRLNQQIIGIGMNQDNSDKWLLSMEQEEANIAVKALNLGAHFIEQAGNQRVDKVRAELRRVLLGENPEEPKWRKRIIIITKQLMILAARKLVGEELVEHILDTQLRALVTHESLGLSTDGVAKTMRSISDSIGGPFELPELVAKHVFFGLSLDDLDIYPHIGSDIRIALADEITRQPSND